MPRSTNRYVPISMPLPIGVPRAYYYAEENIPDFDENDFDSYNQWIESIPPANSEREQNSQTPQNNGVAAQWTPKSQAPAASPEASHRERHHMQIHEANPPSDITELFRRKQEDRYGMQQEMIMTDDSSPRYFYRPTTVSRLAAHRLGLERDRSVVSAPPLPSGPPILPHHIGYYQHDEHVGPPHHAYETLVFHSTPQLHRNNVLQKHCQAQIVTENRNMITNVIRPNKPHHMKPAVTVRTPRYFRRSGVYKRPSALCLPLSCELDPAVLQRQMKTRLPSTMPGVQLLSPSQRQHSQQTQIRQLPHQDDDTSNTSRSAPPPYFEFINDIERNSGAPGKPSKLDQSEIERIQQIIEQRTGVKDQQDETTCEEDIVSNNEDSKQADMEYILNQYQQMVDSRNPTETSNKSKPSKASSKTRKTKVSSNSKINVVQMLKPKIPPSLKQKRASKHNVKTEEKCQKDKDKIEIERITSSVLDTLLHDLQTSGIINDDTKSDINTPESNKKTDRPTTASSSKNCRESPHNNTINESRRENDVDSTDTIQSPKIQNLHQNYNYAQVGSSANTQDLTVSSNSQMDINHTSVSEETEKYSKTSTSTQYMSQQPVKKCDQIFGQEGDSLNNNIHSVTRNLNCFYNQHMNEDKEPNSSKYKLPSNMSNQQWPPPKKTLKYPHDDHTAMELHRSKSYIVNLIDRALSRELGTIPEERTSKHYMNLEARTALDLMSSPAAKNMDNDMCLEITQVLADSISTAPVKDTMPCSSTCSTPKPNCTRGETNKLTDDLMYHSTNDEPMYIKQLKKLRWGHLKHIQREMRRLEDLENFLDSCSSEK